MLRQALRSTMLGLVAAIILLATHGAAFADTPAAGSAKRDTDTSQRDGDTAKRNGDTVKRDADATVLPLDKVVMYNAGVSFFEHRGKVDGDASVDLKFRVDNINDLLKSMVLQDLGGGRISTVTYGSKDPITKTLQTFAIDLTNNPTLGQILNQVRGERVEVNAPNAITGVIVGVETRTKQVGKEGETVQIELLNLLTDAGLRSVPLESIGHVKLLDEKLDADFRQALQVLAMSHATDKKTVSLNFLGQGQRPVRVGYIQETPVWKTSYRLVLKDDEQPFLQGWALVENTTESDWKDVKLTLVSGRPISFVMDLYDPLYVGRPTVEPELYASLRPQKYGQDLADRERALAEASAPQSAAMGGGMGGVGTNELSKKMLSRSSRSKSEESERITLGWGAQRIVDGTEAQFGYAKADDNTDVYFAPGQGVKSAAQASDVGELFQYVIDTPVTLPRQQSAMLPIVNESVKGEKVSIYNPRVQSKHPLNGLKLVNATQLHLMQGPITVFDGGAYAGDAQIEDITPGGERLISYALDLDTEVAPKSDNKPQELLSVRITKGILQSEYKLERSQEYVIKNSGKKAKQLLVEHPLEPEWKLITPEKPSETTRDLYRFSVKAEPGKPAELKIKESRTINQQVALTNLNDGTIVVFLRSKVVSDKVKKALQEIVERKQAIQAVIEKRQQLEQQLATIDTDQQRVRQNMDRLGHDTDLYKRYVTQLNTQEDKVGELREQIQKVQGDETTKRRSFDEYITNLDVS